eukprot:5449671-Pyramimonas_sp.AAC.1
MDMIMMIMLLEEQLVGTQSAIISNMLLHFIHMGVKTANHALRRAPSYTEEDNAEEEEEKEEEEEENEEEKEEEEEEEKEAGLGWGA